MSIEPKPLPRIDPDAFPVGEREEIWHIANLLSQFDSYVSQFEDAPHHLSVAAALQSCGKGCSVWSRLAMRRRPRVNQDVMLRRTRLGCWSGRLRSAGVAWWRASHWPVETAR